MNLIDDIKTDSCTIIPANSKKQYLKINLKYILLFIILLKSFKDFQGLQESK